MGLSFTIAAGPRQRGPRIYIAQEQGGPIIPPGTAFPFRRLIRLAGLRWGYWNPSPHSIMSKTSIISLTYCDVFGVFNPFTSRVYVTDHFWTPNVTYSVLETPFGLLLCFITTSLVVTTISFYNVLWPSDVVSRSGPGSSALVLWSPLIWSSLISLYLPKSTLLSRSSPYWYENTLSEGCLLSFCVRCGNVLW
jgi:hypothetical protein